MKIENYGSRSEDEKDLEFRGFLIFTNKFKKETVGVISDLREGLSPKMCNGQYTVLEIHRRLRDAGKSPVDTPQISDQRRWERRA